MNKPITMREMQKMSGQAIRALPHTMPIKCGRETVGFIVPLRQGGSMSKERAERIMQLGAIADASRSPESQRLIDEWLATNGER
jgi:hypothetical protein